MSILNKKNKLTGVLLVGFCTLVLGLASCDLLNFEIGKKTAAAVQFSPAGGDFAIDQTVIITSATAGAEIRYTTDGSAPTAGATLYSGPISVAGDGTSLTIKAIAIKAGMNDSTTAAATYSIQYSPAAAPQFSLPPGTYDADQTVSITSATAGAAIRYTTDGSTPTAGATLYSGPISVAGDGTSLTIKAIAIKAGKKDSAVTVGSYSINYAQVSTPQFSLPPGTYDTDQTVSITSATAGAAIRYTTDGSTPSLFSAPYLGPITISGNGNSLTLKVIAIKAGMSDSMTAAATYSIQYSPAAAPQFSIVSGTYGSDQTVAITSATAGAEIRYTTDGSAPTAFSTLYTGPIPVVGDGTSLTIKAIAVASQKVDSTVAFVSISISKVLITAGMLVTSSGYTVPVYWKNGVRTDLPVIDAAKGGIAISAAASGSDVYVSGQVRNSSGIQVPCYWKNGIRFDLPVLDSSQEGITGLITISNNDIYVAGSVKNASGIFIPCYWKNGVRTDLSVLDATKEAQAGGLAVSAGDVYLSGFTTNSSSVKVACFWKNGVRTELPVENTALDSRAQFITISNGDVYAAGSSANSAGTILPTLWKNSVPTLFSGADPLLSGVANAVALSGNDVYVAGLLTNTFGGTTPCVWKNGTRTDLPVLDLAKASAVLGLVVSGNDVFVTGYVTPTTAFFFPCFWKNGVRTAFTLETGLVGGMATMGTLAP